MLLLTDELLVEIVDLSLKGSGYAVECWQLVRARILAGKEIDGDDLDRIDELVDRARDDLEGPKLRVDLEKMRIY